MFFVVYVLKFFFFSEFLIGPQQQLGSNYTVAYRINILVTEQISLKVPCK